MVKRTLLTILAISMLSGIYTLFPAQASVVYAEKCKSENSLTFLSIKPWYSGLCSRSAEDCKPTAINDDVRICSLPGDLVVIALNFLTIAFQLAGYAAVGLVIWGGIKYILANGDSGKIAAAKTTIQNALIGLLIVLVAVTLVNFVTTLYG